MESPSQCTEFRNCAAILLYPARVERSDGHRNSRRCPRTNAGRRCADSGGITFAERLSRSLGIADRRSIDDGNAGAELVPLPRSNPSREPGGLARRSRGEFAEFLGGGFARSGGNDISSARSRGFAGSDHRTMMRLSTRQSVIVGFEVRARLVDLPALALCNKTGTILVVVCDVRA